MPDSPTPAQGRRDDEPHEDHGHSIAAWTAVGIILLGSLVMSVAVVMTTLWIFIIGAVVVVVGMVAGKVLSAMGFGQPARDNDPAGIS